MDHSPVFNSGGVGYCERTRSPKPKFFAIRFPVILVPDMSSSLAKYGISATPIVLFGDAASKKTIYAHAGTTDDKSRKVFEKKIHMILDTCENNN